MPRPRRALTTTGPIIGNNDRVVYPAQALLAGALEKWLSRLAHTHAGQAKRLGCETSMISKMIHCHTRVPKHAVAKWSGHLRLRPEERRILGIVAELCQLDTAALAYVNPRWQDAVKRLSKELEDVAEMRALAPKLNNIP